MTQLWQLAIVYGVLVALGLSATGHVVGSAVVSRWFIRRRATALSVLGAASMAGMSLLVPVAMWLILTVGWRATYAIIGLASVVVLLPLALWVVRESPESMGLAPDGLPPEAPRRHETRAPERTTVMDARPDHALLAALRRHVHLRVLDEPALGARRADAHRPRLSRDARLVGAWACSAPRASWAPCSSARSPTASAVGPSSPGSTGRVPCSSPRCSSCTTAPQALLVISALGGASMSGSLAMTSALTADIFGRFSVGSIFGTIFVVHQGGAALGSWLGGLLFELTGGYGAAFSDRRRPAPGSRRSSA